MARRRHKPSLQEIRQALARRCLEAFMLQMNVDYQMGWFHRRICEELDIFLQAVVEKRSPRLMIAAPPRHGKLCADYTPVLTTEGWKMHGELRCGDFVFSPSGEPVEVIAVGEKDYATHRVKFTNGDEIDVHLDHEWTIYSRPHRRNMTVETRFFLDGRRLDWGVPGTRGHRYLFQVDVPYGLRLPERKHVLPPYVLGVWLGDGTSSKPVVNMDPEDARTVKRAFKLLGVPINREWVHKQTGVVTFSFAGNIAGRRNVFSKELQRLDLLKNKHIPQEYMLSSLEERLELLAGLVDTDGSYDAKAGRYRFVTASLRLAEDVAELVRTCGVPCHVNARKPDGRDRLIKSRQELYAVSFFPDFCVPCRLKRKSNALRIVAGRPRRMGIESVTPLDEPVLGNCIQVDSPDGLYLVGKHLTPTHNSQIASRCFPAYALGRHPDLSIIAASYSADLSSRMNRDVQRIMDSPEYAALFPETSLSGKNIRTVAQGSYLRNSDIFEVVGHRGVYRSTGVGGGITGMGAECVDADSLILLRYGCVHARHVVPGMKICAYDFASKRIRQCTVKAVTMRTAETHLVSAGRFRLHATGNHPVYAEGEGFVPVERLVPASTLYCADSLDAGRCPPSVQKAALVSVRKDLEGPRQVVDIEVEGCHNFFANGILVHNCAIIDDPVKDRAEADSVTISKSVWDWYTSTAYTLLARGGGVILIQTRWSENDLSGRLLEAQARGEGDQWRVVSFPAIAEHDEEFRKAGEALHPERYPLDQLIRIKNAVGSRDWAALYQQRPAPEGGAIFRKEWLERRWTRASLPNRFDAFVMAFDMAFKGTDTSDFVVGQLWAKAGPDYYLLEQERGRWSFTESIEAVRRLSAKASGFTKHPVRTLIEDKANGPAVIDVLKRELSGIVPVQAVGSKESRAHAVTALFEAGNVVLPHPSEAPWVVDFEAELLSFPSGAHDDQVDCVGYALRHLSSGNRLSFAPELKQRLASPMMRLGRR